MDSDHSAELERLGVTYEVLLDFVSKQRIGTELLLAAIVIYVYDILTTFDLEIRFVWSTKPRITLAKVLFTLNRYVPMVGFSMRFFYFTNQTPANPLCKVSMASAYLTVLNFATVELVLMLRIWVLYGKSRRLGIIMAISFFLTIGAGLALRNVQPTVVAGNVLTPPVTVTICKRSPPSEYFWGYLFGVFLEVFNFSLLLNRIWKTKITSPVLEAVLSHGALYYLTVISMFVFTIVATTTNALFWPVMDSNIAICISCVACNHLVLSLRGLFNNDNDPKVQPASDGGHDLLSSKTQTYYLGQYPSTKTSARVPPSSTGSVTLDGGERVPTMG